MKRLVYRINKEEINKGPITELNPSYNLQWTNQIYENNKWKFVNRYIGKFGARPIIWYSTKELAEQYSPKDNDIANSIEWDGIDDEGYKNVFKTPINIMYINQNGIRMKKRFKMNLTKLLKNWQIYI